MQLPYDHNHDDPRHDLALLNTLKNSDQKDIQLFS
jgi:hypothetical protein